MSDLSINHFRNILECESKNLEKLCEEWSKILENNSTTPGEDKEELFGSIRSTIGQAKLLMSQRFKQFSNLIDNCEFNTGQHPTRLDDLAGFWEMIYFQVEDVKKKFSSLSV